MSFDLAFWYATEADPPPSEILERLGEGRPGVVQPVPDRIEAFYADVVAIYPEPDVVEEGEDYDEEDENSPWASGIYRNEECVWMSISWSRGAELKPVVLDLARKHGLVTYDPQQDVLQA